MGRSSNPGRGGGRGSGKGGRGRGGWNKKKNSNSDKKDTTNKKLLFTLLQSTVDVRVSSYETTLKKMYQQLMKDIKKYPEDVIDSLKEKKKEVLSAVTLSTSVPLGKLHDEIEQARLENEAYKLDFVHQKRDARIRDQTLDSNLRVAYTIIFSNFCDKELQNCLENKKDFTTKIENDPIELLAAIREMIHTTSHERLIYPFETLWTSLAALFKLKQEKEEKLSDYYDKMKAFSVQVKNIYQMTFFTNA